MRIQHHHEPVDGLDYSCCSFTIEATIPEKQHPIVMDAMSLSDTVSEIDHLSEEQRDCIEICTEAAEACEWCADACTDHGEDMAECIRLCRDVADVASLHARFMARDSDYSDQLGELCADVCEACADECEQHDHDHCQLCADVLSECAESCRSMH